MPLDDAVSSLPKRVQLTGGDYFIHALDRRMRRAGMPGNICRMSILLDGALDVEQIRRRVAESPVFDWLSRVRMVRRLPILPPAWRTQPRSATVLQEYSCNGAATDPATGLPRPALDRTFSPDQSPALALDLFRHSDGTFHLVFSWHHSLMDLRGAELLLRHLHGQAGNGDAPDAADLVSPAQTGFSLLRTARAWPRKILFARGSLAVINSTCQEPLFSLVPPGQPSAVRRHSYRVIPFSSGETGRIDAHCERLNAGFRRSLFYLACSIQALHPIAIRRGNAPGAYLVPVPHDSRRPGARGPIFSNQLSFLFYRIEPCLASDLNAMISQLTRQMMDQVRHRSPASFMAAMELFKPMPLDFYNHRLGRPTRGKFASFFFSDAGETCLGIDSLLGARLQSVTHLAPASHPPGLTVVFSRFRNELSAVLGWVDDCLNPDEVDHLERGLRAALLAGGAS